ncbi:MAG TPA: hypothetical protein VN259_17665 [Xanthomonadales bacterium]|nr:hypothetical protein [Xanthomonadales bacterium]
MNRILVSLVALCLALPLTAKQLTVPDTVTAAPAFSTIDGLPLKINVGAENSYQIFNDDLPDNAVGQIYPTDAAQTADMGWFVRVGTSLYAPNFGQHPGGTATGSLGSFTPYGETSLTPTSGAGTSASPYAVTVVTNLGDSGLIATKTITYVNGDNYFSERFRVRNTSGNTQQVTIFLGSDIYLANSDAGVPFREPTSGSPGGRTCAGVTPEYTILHIPLTPADRFTAVGYSDVWSQIGGGQLNNTVGSGCIDNGAALQWNFSVVPGGSATVLSATSFGEVPPITQFNITDVNPAQGLIGSSLSVTVTGYGFVPQTSFTFGPGIAVGNVTIVNQTTALVSLEISPSAQFGFRDVIATQVPGGLTATLVDGFAVVDLPVWNYSILAGSNVNQQAVACVRAKFPGNPATNAPGWAPNEGTWYVPNNENPPYLPYPPTGLARAILDCFVLVWIPNFGQLAEGYCWEEPSPQYLGEYPHERLANLRIYNGNNGVCAGPLPGATVFEENVGMTRQEFYPTPLGRSGFEAENN